jgi:aminocarboxymuconate-semialdehyde decarboxylase
VLAFSAFICENPQSSLKTCMVTPLIEHQPAQNREETPMPTRRQFFGTASSLFGGLAFCSCGMLEHARAQGATGASTRRAPLIINGQAIKVIDTHSHCLFHESLALMGGNEAALIPPTKGAQEHFIVVEERLRSMAAQGVDMEVLSINPFWYRQERDVAGEICRINNENLASLCKAHPDRFAAFASVPMQFPDLAVQHLENAVGALGLRGAAIGASVSGESFSDPKFYPVLAKAQELGAVLFIHPQSTPELAKRFKGNGWLSNVIGNPLDTTLALQHLIFEGTLDRFPDLKILAAHGGGYLGSYAPRSDHGCFVSPQNCDPSITLKKKPTEYLNQLHFDALVFTAEALRHLVAQVGASQIVVGTDHPIPWEEHPVDHIMGTPSLSDADRIAILQNNATKLLRIAV